MKKLHGLVILLFFIVLLRLPYFFEPHWYSDETIYLTLAQALKRGAILYRDIYDLKPPLIYFTYFLVQSHLLGARLLATFSVLLTSLVIFRFSRSLVAMALFGFLVSTTVFEGGVANTEIFMILPVTLAMFLAYQKKVNPFGLGILFGLAFLFKTVAVLDLLALILYLFLIKNKSGQFLKEFIFLFGGFLIPLGLASFYFFLNHAFTDFMNSVFLYNASYVYPQNMFLKIFLLFAICYLLFANQRKISNLHLLFYLWFAFSTFGAIFAGRPYPHYFIQVLPSFSLLLASSWSSWKRTRTWQLSLLTLLVIFSLVISFKLGGFYLYPVRSYYQNFFLKITGQEPQEKYLGFFNPLLPSIYQTADFLKKNAQPQETLLVLADYPQIYELSGLRPATRFIALHHLDIVPGAKEAVYTSLSANPPKYIVIMSTLQIKLPKIEEFIRKNYSLSFTAGNFKVFQPR